MLLNVDAQDDRYVNTVCVCACKNADTHVQVIVCCVCVCGGGVIITPLSYQWESPFPFKSALCSSFPAFRSFPFPLHLCPHLSLSTSESAISLISPPYLLSFSHSFSSKCPKSIHCNAFMHAFCAPWRRRGSFFLPWVHSELLFCTSTRLEKRLVKVGADMTKSWKTKLKGMCLTPWWNHDFMYLDRGEFLKCFQVKERFPHLWRLVLPHPSTYQESTSYNIMLAAQQILHVDITL